MFDRALLVKLTALKPDLLVHLSLPVGRTNESIRSSISGANVVNLSGPPQGFESSLHGENDLSNDIPLRVERMMSIEGPGTGVG